MLLQEILPPFWIITLLLISTAIARPTVHTFNFIVCTLLSYAVQKCNRALNRNSTSEPSFHYAFGRPHAELYDEGSLKRKRSVLPFFLIVQAKNKFLHREMTPSDYAFKNKPENASQYMTFLP